MFFKQKIQKFKQKKTRNNIFKVENLYDKERELNSKNSDFEKEKLKIKKIMEQKFKIDELIMENY